MTLLLAGCAVVPDSIVKQPMSAKPPRAATPTNNGAIYQIGSYRPLLEDKRAHYVGDIITIIISETNNAGKNASSSGSKSGSVAAGIPTVFGLPFKTVQGMSVSASSSDKNAATNVLSSADNFTSTLAVTVVDVEANGDLVVSGEKQVSLDTGVEYIRFSGIVDPATIVSGNIVSSTQVADAKIEYRSDTRIDKASVMSAMTKFFLSVAPF
ncbi:MAG TPA: flagellar basal body L-ring protein FlgH [Burkholderiales bacterium]|nr:flagellar basal body L-ring protein FlgH [Burkholderiales bacterium]